MKSLILSLLLLVCVNQSASASPWLDPALEQFKVDQSATLRIPVIVMLEIPDTQVRAPYRYDSTGVIYYLKTLTAAGLKNIPAAMITGTNPNARVMEIYWINLSFLAQVTPKGLLELFQTPGIAKIYANRHVNYPAVGRMPAPRAEFPYNFKETHLDKLIQERGDIDGRGVFVGHVDTGVDGAHPALSGRVALFFDGQKLAQPTDSDQHGTHTSGTILGGNRTDNLIGVAPGAKLISAGFLQSYDQVLRGMQWIIDPDGDPKTKDAPRVVSNSWNAEGAPDIELFYRAIGSWEAAGILPVFSAGNSGPKPRSITKPHEYPGVLAIAATGPDGKVANFSSRGPAVYKGQEVAKPDISAPGVDILSSIPGGKYAKFSGTSMACPHAAGAVALILQVNPNLNPAQIRDLLRATATPVDGNGQPIQTPAWNPAYGMGKLDIYKAVKTAAMLVGADRILPKMFELPIPYFFETKKSDQAKFKMVSMADEGGSL